MTLSPPRYRTTFCPIELPSELTTGSRFVLWKYGKRGNTSKPTKPPVSLDGSFASSTDPSTWSEFSEVIAAYEVSTDKFEGIGIVFTEDDRLAGIDLDGCRDPDTGVINPTALALVQQFDSYTEISPSGTGLHIFVYGSMSGLERNKTTYRGIGIEMYDRGRYFTLTGSALANTPSKVFERQQELVDVHTAVFGKTTVESVINPARYPLNDEDTISNNVLKLIEGNKKLGRLWHRTENTEYWSDDSPSAWCYRLARLLATINVQERNIAVALVEYRRKHGDPHKALPWYRREAVNAVNSPHDHGASHIPIGLSKISPAELTTLLAMDAAFRHARLLKSSSQQILLVALARFVSENHTSYPSQIRLAEALDRGTSWVSRQMGELRKAGCIEIERMPSPGRNTEYRLNLKDETHHR